MADGHSLTLRAALDKVMSDEHADVVREGVAAFVAELMEAEVAQQIGAELHDKAPGRVTHRNGYRSREWDTRAGTSELEIPRLRSGRTSRASWSRARAPSRRWWRWSRRRTSTASRRGRSTGWCSSSVSGA